MLLTGGEVIVSMISREFISEAIADTTYGIYSLLKNTLISNNETLKNLIEELDLTTKLTTINILIEDINKSNSTKILTQCLTRIIVSVEGLSDEDYLHFTNRKVIIPNHIISSNI